MATGRDAQATALMVRVRDGDRAAYAVVYAQFAPRMVGIALNVLHDRHHAEDAAQEALLQAWTRASSFDPDKGSGTGWLFRLAHARAVDRVRAIAAARRADQRHTDQFAAEVITGDEPWLATVQKFEQARLVDLMRGLPPAQVQTLVLAYYGGLTRRQIADQVGSPVGTVKWRHGRGLQQLSEALTAADL